MRPEDKITAEERAVNKALLDNHMYMSLMYYFKYGAPGGDIWRVKFTKERSIVICKMRYGKSNLYFEAYIDEKGAVNTMVFNFREIFDKYVAKKAVEKHGDDYEDFVYKVLRQANFAPDYVCLFSNYKGGFIDDEEYPAFGISLVGYKNEEFNLITPWAGVLNEVLNAIDEVLGFKGNDKKNKLTRQAVDKAAVKYPMMGVLAIALGYLAIIGGIILLIVNKSWAPFLKWLLGIVLILAGLFFGPMIHLSVISDKKGYYSNSGDIMKKFHVTEKKMFPTVKD